MNEQQTRAIITRGQRFKTKPQTSSYITFLSGILISLIICAYANAQLTGNRTATNNYTGTIQTTRTGEFIIPEESGEVRTTSTNNGSSKTIRVITESGGTESQGNQQTQGEVKTTEKLVIVKGFPRDSIATITNTIYYNEVGLDMNMTMKGENGTFELTRQSGWINNAGQRERSFGQCQLMEIYHAPFIWKDGYTEIRPGYYKVTNPSGFTDNFLDPVKHAHYCVSVWKDAERKGRLRTTFYAYDTRHKFKNDFTILDK